MSKNFLIVVLLLASLTLGWLLFAEKRRNHEQTTQVEFLTTKVSQQKEESQKAKAAVAEAERRRQQAVEKLKARTQSLREAVAQAAQTGPSPASETANSAATALASIRKGVGGKSPASPFSASITKMMKDPAMKNMMRSSRSIALKQMYGDLVKKWSLSSEETEAFYNLLLDRQASQIDLGMKGLERGPDAASEVKTDDLDIRLKTSLGDDLYQQYRDYEKTIGGRYAVNQFQQSLATSNVLSMTPDQSAAMLQTINDENLNVPKGMFGTPGKFNGFNLDQEQVDNFVKAQEDLNTRTAGRASQILNADQLRIFKEQQAQLLAMQKMTMEMASKMMADPSPTP